MGIHEYYHLADRAYMHYFSACNIGCWSITSLEHCKNMHISLQNTAKLAMNTLTHVLDHTCTTQWCSLHQVGPTCHLVILCRLSFLANG